MPVVYLGLGTNLGDGRRNLECAPAFLGATPEIRVTRGSTFRVERARLRREGAVGEAAALPAQRLLRPGRRQQDERIGSIVDLHREGGLAFSVRERRED